MGSDYPAWASREGELQIQQTGTIGIFGAKHMEEPETELMTAGRLGSRPGVHFGFSLDLRP